MLLPLGHFKCQSLLNNKKWVVMLFDIMKTIKSCGFSNWGPWGRGDMRDGINFGSHLSQDTGV